MCWKCDWKVSFMWFKSVDRPRFDKLETFHENLHKDKCLTMFILFITLLERLGIMCLILNGRHVRRNQKGLSHVQSVYSLSCSKRETFFIKLFKTVSRSGAIKRWQKLTDVEEKVVWLTMLIKITKCMTRSDFLYELILRCSTFRLRHCWIF